MRPHQVREGSVARRGGARARAATIETGALRGRRATARQAALRVKADHVAGWHEAGRACLSARTRLGETNAAAAVARARAWRSSAEARPGRPPMSAERPDPPEGRCDCPHGRGARGPTCPARSAGASGVVRLSRRRPGRRPTRLVRSRPALCAKAIVRIREVAGSTASREVERVRHVGRHVEDRDAELRAVGASASVTAVERAPRNRDGASAGDRTGSEPGGRAPRSASPASSEGVERRMRVRDRDFARAAQSFPPKRARKGSSMYSGGFGAIGDPSGGARGADTRRQALRCGVVDTEPGAVPSWRTT